MQAAAPKLVLPEGYTLLDRLGSGGYGEVYRATAPGGMEKAVKIVFGHYDEELAERELKSLQRVKAVRHPFLLSIERYEIVNNRLVIVTELADTSLDKLYQSHKEKGEPGVPRDSLLTLLGDAAEALDCLSVQHQLQHLDVKPENLLIVGDHVMVADYGLVKELANRTLNTMIGGMTPLYSAPEIYDGAPTSYSDQYSLAIVYQQMLTGAVPFSGRTPAQLAKQHTMAEPNLGSLNPEDRPIVLRALAKEPEARFSSCREFIKALRDGQTGRLPTHSRPEQGPYEHVDPPEDETKSAGAIGTKPIRLSPPGNAEHGAPASPQIPAPSRAKRASPPLNFPAVQTEIVDAQVTTPGGVLKSARRPTLFVSLGGIGAEMLGAIRTEWNGLGEDAPPSSWLAIDTDRDSLKTRLLDERSPLAPDDVLHIPLRRPKQYRDASNNLLHWVSRRWLYNIPRSLMTRSYRPLGRIAAVDNAAAVVQKLREHIQQLQADREQGGHSEPVHAVILAGTSGGTGGGIAIDIAQAIKNLGTEASVDVRVRGVFGVTVTRSSPDQLASTNLVSFLTELAHAQEHGNQSRAEGGRVVIYERDASPYDDICVTAIPPRSRGHVEHNALRQIAGYLTLRSTHDLDPVLESGAAKVGRPNTRLSSFGVAFPEQIESRLLESLEHEAIRQVLSALKQESESQFCIDESLKKSLGEYSGTRLAQELSVLIPPKRVVEAHEDPSNHEERPDENARERAIKRVVALAELWSERDYHTAYVEEESAAVVGQVVNQVRDSLFHDLREAVLNSDGAEEADARFCQTVREKTRESLRGSICKKRLSESILSAACIDLIECGHTRMNLFIQPENTQDDALHGELTNDCASLVSLSASVSNPVFLREATGLSMDQVAAQIAKSIPDVATAASRLHTRSDIPWRDLRSWGAR